MLTKGILKKPWMLIKNNNIHCRVQNEDFFLACEQVVHENYKQKEMRAREASPLARVFSRSLLHLPWLESFLGRLIFFKQDIEFMSSHCCQD